MTPEEWAARKTPEWGKPRDPWEKSVFEGWDGDHFDNDWTRAQFGELEGQVDFWIERMRNAIGNWPEKT